MSNTNVQNPIKTRLNKKSLHIAVDCLCEKDKDLKLILDQYGYPPLWSRPANYETLVQIILEQQVSLSSAKAVFNKLKNVLISVTPENILVYSIDDLNKLGFTKQKASYCVGLAEKLVAKEISLRNISQLDTKAAHEQLIQLRGIGTWSANIYLLMALKHPDIWPHGDLALENTIVQIKKLRKKPSQERVEAIAENWRPWRSVAARILWHFYLSK